MAAQSIQHPRNSSGSCAVAWNGFSKILIAPDITELFAAIADY